MCAARNPVSRRRGRPPHDDVLTPAEWVVVHAVRHGMSYAGIAARRGISRDAVKYHVGNALTKLGLRTRRELQRWRGVPKDSAAFHRRSNEELAMTARDLRLGPIGQISRTVRDIDAACAWYGKVLGLKHLYTFGKLAFFDCGGTRLYLSAEGRLQDPNRASTCASTTSLRRMPSSSRAASSSRVRHTSSIGTRTAWKSGWRSSRTPTGACSR